MSIEDTFMEFVQEKFDRKLKEEMETESEEVLPIYNVIMQNPGKRSVNWSSVKNTRVRNNRQY